MKWAACFAGLKRLKGPPACARVKGVRVDEPLQKSASAEQSAGAVSWWCLHKSVLGHEGRLAIRKQ